MSNALFISILQVKTPPDMQGRIFSIVAQLGFLGATTSFLLTGPLVDRILEPAVGDTRWQWVEPVVGNQPGAGIGLLLVVVGLVILTSTAVMYALPRIRRLELALPDYEVVAVNS
jgi:MFS transporter, DHA3 family, macrolide efflux protein